MSGKQGSGCIAAILACIFVGTVLWAGAIILKASGVIGIGWPAVLGSLVWLCWAMIALVILAAGITRWIAKLKHWIRARKEDRRIIRQAKAMDMWNLKAGGRALELYAKQYGLQHLDGESDVWLRARIFNAQESRTGEQ